jgi:ribosomal protein S18 acetylase RimI-like enzyme
MQALNRTRVAARPDAELTAVRPLGPDEVPALAALERAAWPGPLQASEERIARRLALGHCILVSAGPDYLVASLCFAPTREEPFDRSRFPRDFATFSSMPRSEPVRSCYVYNLCVHPAWRGAPVVRPLMRAGVEHARGLGARWLVADGRCPSYAGAIDEGPDKVRADPAFRAAIDAWAATGQQPPDEELLRDPLLRFYRRMVACQFLHLMPDFLPEDRGSGGYRVIFASDLDSPTLLA